MSGWRVAGGGWRVAGGRWLVVHLGTKLLADSVDACIGLFSRAKALCLAIEERVGLRNVLAEEAKCHAMLTDLPRATMAAREALRLGQEIGNGYAVNVAIRVLQAIRQPPTP